MFFDIKQAARSYCPKAIEKLAMHMNSEDDRVSIAACIALIERGYGKPEQKADIGVTHKFALVPQVMEQADWIANKGQPKQLELKVNDDPDRKLN